MTALAALFVAARIVSNPVSNVFQKRLTQQGGDPAFVIAASHLLLTLICGPALLLTPWSARSGFWPNMWICAALAVASNVLLVAALRTSDLSLLGPINAWKPVVSLLAGLFLLDERPGAAGLGGIALIVAGSYVLFDGPVRLTRDRGVQLRFAALALSATEAVFLKRAILASSPTTAFLWWSVLGAALSAPFLRRASGSTRWPEYLGLAAATGAMQYATLLAFERMPVGYALALFQLSAVLSVLLGRHFFQERGIARRLAASAIMAAGAAAIILE